MDLPGELTSDHSTDNGFYVDFKLGAKGPVVAGVEGSFKLQIKTKTETGVEAATNIKGPTEYDKTNPFRITEYHLEGYWLRPNNNGYWVPEYRKKMGDKPWFITYQVTDGWLQGWGGMLTGNSFLFRFTRIVLECGPAGRLLIMCC